MAYDKIVAADDASYQLPPLVRGTIEANLRNPATGEGDAVQDVADSRITVARQNGILSPNYVINGGMDIWQRGINITSSSTSPYGADRWEAFRQGYAANLSSQKWDGPLTDGIQYCLRLVRAAGDTNTTIIYCGTALETANSIPLRGKTVTLSFYARKGSGMSASGSVLRAILLTGTGTNQNVRNNLTGAVEYVNTVTLTTSWQRFTITAALGSNLSQVAARFSWNPTGTAPANDYVEIAGVQLEEGSVATPFRRNANSIQGELAACRRYFQAYGENPASAYGAFFGGGSSYNDGGAAFTVSLDTPMRAAPSVSFSAGNHFIIGIPFLASIPTTGAASSTVNTSQSVTLTFSHAPNGNAGGYKSVNVSANNTTAARIFMSAEL